MEITVETLLREMVRSHNLEGVTVKATIVKADPRDTIAKTAEQLGAVAVIVGRREVGAMKRFVLCLLLALPISQTRQKLICSEW